MYATTCAGPMGDTWRAGATYFTTGARAALDIADFPAANQQHVVSLPSVPECQRFGPWQTLDTPTTLLDTVASRQRLPGRATPSFTPSTPERRPLVSALEMPKPTPVSTAVAQARRWRNVLVAVHLFPASLSTTSSLGCTSRSLDHGRTERRRTRCSGASGLTKAVWKVKRPGNAVSESNCLKSNTASVCIFKK